MNTLEVAFGVIKASAEKNNVSFTTGKEAFDACDSIVMRPLSERILNVGDIIEIPADETDKRWISTPINPKNPKPVLRLLAHIKDTANNERDQEIFYGTMNKCVREHGTGAIIQSGGTVIPKLRGVIKQTDGWKELFGKKIKVTKVTCCAVFNSAKQIAQDAYVYDLDFID